MILILDVCINVPIFTRAYLRSGKNSTFFVVLISFSFFEGVGIDDEDLDRRSEKKSDDTTSDDTNVTILKSDDTDDTEE